MKGTLTIIITILFFISCVSNHEIKKDLKTLQSKRITFPTEFKPIGYIEPYIYSNSVVGKDESLTNTRYNYN